MNGRARSQVVQGPVGELVCAVDEPAGGAHGMALVCHPHPLHGGTMDNKVVQTMARAFVLEGWRAVRFNFRGVDGSQGQWDEGRGEIDDALAVASHWRRDDEPLALAGFSFGAYVASQARVRLGVAGGPVVLVAPAVGRFPCADVPADALVVHAQADDVVPLPQVLDWALPQLLPVVVVPGGGHFFHGQLPLLRSILRRHLRGVAQAPSDAS